MFSLQCQDYAQDNGCWDFNVTPFSISNYGHFRKLSTFDHLEQNLKVICPQKLFDIMKIQYFDFV